jgi:hypothetical protein
MGFPRFYNLYRKPITNVVIQRCKKWLIKHQSGPVEGHALHRLLVLSAMISALIRGGRASLQSLGKHMDADTDLESRVKQAKRWLSSKWTDSQAHFIPYLAPIIRALSQSGELILAIDGSGIGEKCSALMVSVLWRRRAIPLCWVVRDAPKGHFSEQAHLDLLEQVAILLDTLIEIPCRIVLLGDGEFDSAALQQRCVDQGWDYVLKTAKDTLLADNPEMENASHFGHLAPARGEKSLFLADVYVFKQGFGAVNALYWHEPRYADPLFLLTNLEYAPKAAAYYRKRYHIETFFGDIKSRGFNIHRTRIDDTFRLFNLLIVASLAFILAILFEFDARRSPHLGKFCRKDRVSSYSVFQIGLMAILYYSDKAIPIPFQFSKNFP